MFFLAHWRTESYVLPDIAYWFHFSSTSLLSELTHAHPSHQNYRSLQLSALGLALTATYIPQQSHPYAVNRVAPTNEDAVPLHIPTRETYPFMYFQPFCIYMSGRCCTSTKPTTGAVHIRSFKGRIYNINNEHVMTLFNKESWKTRDIQYRASEHYLKYDCHHWKQGRHIQATRPWLGETRDTLWTEDKWCVCVQGRPLMMNAGFMIVCDGVWSRRCVNMKRPMRNECNVRWLCAENDVNREWMMQAGTADDVNKS